MRNAQWQDPPEYRDPGGGGGGVQMAMPPLTPAVKRIIQVTGGVFLAHFLLFVLPFTRPLAEWLNRWFAIAPDTWGGAPVFLPVWQLVTWGLLHSLTDPFHVLFNMLFLYFLGTMLEEIVGSRRLLLAYVSALVVSGLCTLGLAFLIGPVEGFDGSSFYPKTLGASGAVYCIVVAMAALRPTRRIIFLLFPITLKTLAILYVGLDLFRFLLQLSGDSVSNVASLAHLAGAAWGFLLIKRGWIWKDPLAEVETWRVAAQEKRTAQDDEQLDRLLAKINREGIGSLTARERAFLKKASKRR